MSSLQLDQILKYDLLLKSCRFWWVNPKNDDKLPLTEKRYYKRCSLAFSHFFYFPIFTSTLQKAMASAPAFYRRITWTVIY